MHPLHITTRQEKIDWLKARRLSIGASDIPIIMGVSPYKTVEQLLAEKLDTSEPELTTTWPMLNGTIEEPYIRDEYEQQSKLLYPPRSFVKGPSSCSLDGYNELTHTGIEIKYASRKDHESGVIPEKYIYQIAWQYMVSNVTVIRYVSKRYGSNGEPLSVIVAPWPTEKTKYLMYAKATEFWNKVLAEREKQV
jgi:putative phage-type endonuclease